MVWEEGEKSGFGSERGGRRWSERHGPPTRNREGSGSRLGFLVSRSRSRAKGEPVERVYFFYLKIKARIWLICAIFGGGHTWSCRGPSASPQTLPAQVLSLNSQVTGIMYRLFTFPRASCTGYLDIRASCTGHLDFRTGCSDFHNCWPREKHDTAVEQAQYT